MVARRAIALLWILLAGCGPRTPLSGGANVFDGGQLIVPDAQPPGEPTTDSGPEAVPPDAAGLDAADASSEVAVRDAPATADIAALPPDTASPDGPADQLPARDSGIDAAPDARGLGGDGNAATINSLEIWSYDMTYQPQMGMIAFSGGGTYRVSNGASWETGAGSTKSGFMRLATLDRDGTTLVYHMTPDNVLLERTDYDSGQHSANFRLESAGEIVIRATGGSQIGMVSGLVRIALDEPANYKDDRFYLLSAPLGTVVRFTAMYTLRSGVFDEKLFDAKFDYDLKATMDFTSRP